MKFPNDQLSILSDEVISFDRAAAWEKDYFSNAIWLSPVHKGLIWSMPQSLVVPKSIAANNNFAKAQVRMNALGWPVHIRQTGGDVTPQTPNIINITEVFLFSSKMGYSLSDLYQRLCQPIIDFLKESKGVTAYCGEVAGAFCDGKYNIVVEGLKLAGTAQRLRQFRSRDGEPMTAVLGHVSMIGSGETQSLAEACNQFYDLCEIEKNVSAKSHTRLVDIFGADSYDRQSIVSELGHSYLKAWS